MKALIIGATGAIGKDLVQLLLEDKDYDEVDIFVRKPVDIQHPKLKVHVVDFDKPEEWKDLVKGDTAFSCMGTTMKAAGSKDAQYKVDYTYQYNFAKAASENEVIDYVLISSLGANAKSRIFYPRIKGQLEEAVRKLTFHQITILRPPALIRKNTDRATEKLSLPVLRFLNKIGLFRDQTPMETEIVAKAMINVAKKDLGQVIIDGQRIREYAG